MKQLRKGYVDHWSTAFQGSRFNEKGWWKQMIASSDTGRGNHLFSVS
jgi:hypothetical protein